MNGFIICNKQEILWDCESQQFEMNLRRTISVLVFTFSGLLYCQTRTLFDSYLTKVLETALITTYQPFRLFLSSKSTSEGTASILSSCILCLGPLSSVNMLIKVVVFLPLANEAGFSLLL